MAQPAPPLFFSIMPMNSGKDYKAREVDIAQPLMAAGPVGGNQGGDFVVQSVALRGRDGGATAELGGDAAYALRAAAGGGSDPYVLAPIPILEAGARTGTSTTDIRAGMGVEQPGDPMYTLQSGKQHAVGVIPFDTTQPTSPGNYSNPKAGDTGHPLAAGAHVPSVAYQDVVCVTEPVTHTLKGEGFDASEDGTGRGQPITLGFAQNTRDEVRLHLGDGQIVGALAAQPGMKQQTFLASAMAVRRLMPNECHRLQGFPDDWCAVPVGPKGKIAADGPQYKQLGNSWAVNHAHWVGMRIASWLAAQEQPVATEPANDLHAAMLYALAA